MILVSLYLVEQNCLSNSLNSLCSVSPCSSALKNLKILAFSLLINIGKIIPMVYIFLNKNCFPIVHSVSNRDKYQCISYDQYHFWPSGVHHKWVLWNWPPTQKKWFGLLRILLSEYLYLRSTTLWRNIDILAPGSTRNTLATVLYIWHVTITD